MADDAIFLLQAGALTALTETPYAKEDILQKVLEDYPALIAGFATSGESGRLLLVRREMPVPGASGSTGLSLDHLFVDESGVPVLVEVKRSSDTRARREVVAQMLDYVANGVAHWPPNELRQSVALHAQQVGTDEEQLLQERLGVDDAEAFWRVVEDNLRAGKVRCIFLADRLTPGLVRIIEFLNEQMRDTEVLGVELPQFTAQGEAVVYVPRLVGRTTTAVVTKQGGGVRWDKQRLLDEAAQHCTEQELKFLAELLAHREGKSGRFSWGSGATPGVTGWYVVDGVDTPVWNVNVGGPSAQATFYFIFKEYVARHPERAAAYAEAVNQVPGFGPKVSTAQNNDWKSWVGLPLPQVASNQALVLAAVEVACASAAP